MGCSAIDLEQLFELIFDMQFVRRFFDLFDWRR